MAIPINQNIKFLKMEHFNVEPIAACLFVLMKLHMEGPTSALPELCTHRRTYQEIVWLWHDSASVKYLFSWSGPVYEIMVPIVYASSEGRDEPAHQRKIASALTAHIRIEGM